MGWSRPWLIHGCALLLLCAVFLPAPVYVFQYWREIHPWLYLNALAVAGVIWFAAVLLRRKDNLILAYLCLLCGVIAVTIVRLAHALIVNFSGNGFGAEVFMHVEVHAMRVYWDEYWLISLVILSGLLVLLGSLAMCLRALGNDLTRPRRWVLMILLACSVLGGLYTRHYSAEYRLLRSYTKYWQLRQIGPGATAAVDAFQAVGLMREIETNRYALRASINGKQKNLIFVYLESFSDFLMSTEQYPELTPNLRRLKQQYPAVRNNFSSANVTIEGIVNTQCGVLSPMARGNDSFVGGRRLMPALPCLGDVLNQAGYQQVFLGGAIKSFAGKGDFLATHGFDQVLGWEDWQALGYRQEANVWGLADSDLFTEAVKRIRSLKRSDQPYHLSLLSLGTHIPGFVYQACPAYTGEGADERFLQAIYCTDFLVGQFVAELEAQQLLENTILVLTADHGIFATPEMRQLFGDKVQQRSLYTVVLGAVGDITVPAAMASYDWPVIILDWLNIEHNAEFILAKHPLAEPTEYFMSRRYDEQAGRLVFNDGNSCASDATGDNVSLPLQPCGKRQLLLAMTEYLAGFERDRPVNVCAADSVIFALEESGAVMAQVGDRQLGMEFSRLGHPIKQHNPGLYLLVLNANGEIVSQEYWDPLRRRDRAEVVKQLEDIVTEGQFAWLGYLPPIDRSQADLSGFYRQLGALLNIPEFDPRLPLVTELGPGHQKRPGWKNFEHRAGSIRLSSDYSVCSGVGVPE